MSIAFELAPEVPPDTQLLGVPMFSGCRPVPGAGADLDVAFLAERGFEGKAGEVVAMPSAGGVTLVAMGMGEPSAVDAETLRRAGGGLVRTAWKDERVATTLLAAVPPDLDRESAVRAVVEGAGLAAYRFTKYKGDPKPCRIQSFTLVDGDDAAAAREGVRRGALVAAAVSLARDLANEPAGSLTPRGLADAAVEIAEREGLSVTVLDEVAIAKEGLGGLLGVSRGSDEPPRLIELVYDPGPGARGTIALVGKGITFDSGGLSIKTAEGMETMKTDKSGAAAVLAAMSVLPALSPPVKVVALIPTSENMPSGRAVKPGDVLTIRNGKTVEVLNTDAEGRLILADALSLAGEARVDAIIDLATLTGACMVALGKKVAGLMSNSDPLADQVLAAARRAGEAVWRLPLVEDYRKDIDSEVADIKNTGSGRFGGALTAGLFLREFVGDIPWVHLDIAGPARSDGEDGYVPKGATGFGVRTMVEAVLAFQPVSRP